MSCQIAEVGVGPGLVLDAGMIPTIDLANVFGGQQGPGAPPVGRYATPEESAAIGKAAADFDRFHDAHYARAVRVGPFDNGQRD